MPMIAASTMQHEERPAFADGFIVNWDALNFTYQHGPGLHLFMSAQYSASVIAITLPCLALVGILVGQRPAVHYLQKSPSMDFIPV